MQTNFSLMKGNQIYHGENMVCVCIDHSFAKPMLAKLEEIESDEGTNAALAQLQYVMKHYLKGKLREPDIGDTRQITGKLPAFNNNRGAKVICQNCRTLFYDLNGKVSSCPSCKTPNQ